MLLSVGLPLSFPPLHVPCWAHKLFVAGDQRSCWSELCLVIMVTNGALQMNWGRAAKHQSMAPGQVTWSALWGLYGHCTVWTLQGSTLYDHKFMYHAYGYDMGYFNDLTAVTWTTGLTVDWLVSWLTWMQSGCCFPCLDVSWLHDMDADYDHLDVVYCI